MTLPFDAQIPGDCHADNIIWLTLILQFYMSVYCVCVYVWYMETHMLVVWSDHADT